MLGLPLLDASVHSLGGGFPARAAGQTLRSYLLSENRGRVKYASSSYALKAGRRDSSSSTSSGGISDDSSSSPESSQSGGESASTPPTSPELEKRPVPQNSAGFSFSIAASILGKPSDPSIPKPTHTFSAASPIKEWRDKSLRSLAANPNFRISDANMVSPGDDFFFTSSSAKVKGKGKAVAFGLADGVGGWSESGIDPSLFSQALMYHASGAVEEMLSSEGEKEGALYPHEILQKAFDGVAAEEEVVAGSSTATIVTLDPGDGHFRAANLGDSSFILMRRSSPSPSSPHYILHQQPSQVHYFNCPYQLSKLPPSLSNDPSSIGDTPSKADLFEARLEDGDIVLAVTDGFSDNVWGRELEVLVARVFGGEGKSMVDMKEDEKVELMKKLTDSAVSYARICSQKTDKQSPFEAEAKRNRLIYKGGKVDDICVVGALVSKGSL